MEEYFSLQLSSAFIDMENFWMNQVDRRHGDEVRSSLCECALGLSVNVSVLQICSFSFYISDDIIVTEIHRGTLQYLYYVILVMSF